MTNELLTLAEALGQVCKRKGLLVATAESCSGGLIAAAITAVPGSSSWFERGFVTYSNLAKQEMLSVQPGTLKQWGAVSEQTAMEMAAGALRHSRAQLSVAVTGIAGPDGGSVEKPVGTVWFGWDGCNSSSTGQLHRFTGDRTAIREQAAKFALTGLIERANSI